MSKIFVIGLPRTGTTSVCAAFLDMGYKVCHTAYTDAAFDTADVVADTPAYAFYPELDKCFPGSKFIYLHRAEEEWLPSIKALLLRIKARYDKNCHAFHPLFIRSIQQVFGDFLLGERAVSLSDEYLKTCYNNHRERVFTFFCGRDQGFTEIALSGDGSFASLQTFLAKPAVSNESFPKLNGGGKISDWEKIQSPLKISSHKLGGDGRRAFTLFDTLS